MEIQKLPGNYLHKQGDGIRLGYLITLLLLHLHALLNYVAFWVI